MALNIVNLVKDTSLTGSLLMAWTTQSLAGSIAIKDSEVRKDLESNKASTDLYDRLVRKNTLIREEK